MSSRTTIVRAPKTLTDLFDVFERLDRGESVSLAFPATQPGDDPTPCAPSGGPALGLWSSGTTGGPRQAWHPWSELRRSAVADDAFRGWTWASPFRPDSFAGVHVALQAWLTGGRCLDLRGAWEEIGLLIATHQPEALCCTPTFLGLLLPALDETQLIAGSVSAVRWQPRQVTLGGEPLREFLGRNARHRFPDARFSVVYAAAELGIVAKTHRVDGWFEKAQLDARWDAWRINDGVLEVCRNGHWRSTGDRIEMREDCFRVIGRADAIANVGGAKVVLSEIEAAAEEVAGVWCVQAFAQPNPVTGQVVGLRFSVAPGSEPDAVESALKERLRARLPKAAWPRYWERAQPGLGANAKRAWLRDVES